MTPTAEPAPPALDTLEVAVDGEVGHLWLARPDKLNPLSTQALAELEEAAHHHDDHGDGHDGDGHGDGHGNGHGTKEIGAGSGAHRVTE